MQLRWKRQDPAPLAERERAFLVRDLVGQADAEGEGEGRALVHQSGSTLIVVILSDDGEYEVLDAVVVRRADVRVRDGGVPPRA